MFDPSVDPSTLTSDQVFWLDQVQALYNAGADKADGAVRVTDGQVTHSSQIGSSFG